MITPGDEYPLHQSSRPVRDPGHARNLYDRFFFNGYEPDGSLFFAVALGQYPGRNVMDAAFSVIVDGVQHNVRASRLLGDNRLDTRVGPIRVEIVEPLRILRVTVDDAESGISADLTFTQRGPVFDEPHYLWQNGYRTVFDITRLTQNGRYDGSITVSGNTIAVSGDRVHGTRDRSWGVRPIGERETGGAPDPSVRAGSSGFYWLWAPMDFEDEVVLFDVNEFADGVRWHESAMRAAAGGLDQPVERGELDYRFDYAPGTRHARHVDLDLTFASGKRSYQLEPVFNFYMQGIGYTHPTWGHGMYVGEDVRSHDSSVTAEADESAPLNQHVQAFCRITRDDGARGVGILEQLIFGPHEPSGLTGLLDMHD